MHIYRNEDASFTEPAGHFGGLRTTNLVSWATSGDNYAIQLGITPPGGGGEDHKHDVEHQIFIVTKGEYWFRSGDREFTLKEGEAVLFEPGDYHETLNKTDSDVHAIVVTIKP